MAFAVEHNMSPFLPKEIMPVAGHRNDSYSTRNGVLSSVFHIFLIACRMVPEMKRKRKEKNAIACQLFFRK